MYRIQCVNTSVPSYTTLAFDPASPDLIYHNGGFFPFPTIDL